jgi:hypothetical protein
MNEKEITYTKLEEFTENKTAHGFFEKGEDVIPKEIIISESKDSFENLREYYDVIYETLKKTYENSTGKIISSDRMSFDARVQHQKINDKSLDKKINKIISDIKKDKDEYFKNCGFSNTQNYLVNLYQELKKGIVQYNGNQLTLIEYTN